MAIKEDIIKAASKRNDAYVTCVMQITAISVAALAVSTTALWADGLESINHHDMMWRGLGHLRGRGKHHSAVLVAVARELAGHVWAIARMVEPKMA